MAGGGQGVTGPIRLEGSWLSELVSSAERQSWHSDEDNDVLVSHRITQQTRSHRAGVGGGSRGFGGGQAGPRGAQNAPVSGASGPKKKAWPFFSVPISSAELQHSAERMK